MAQRILLVEDDPRLVTVLSCALSAEGFQIESAPNGVTAITRIPNEPFDLVLLDVGLPDLSGFDVCRELRRRGITTPIVMLTGRVEMKDKILGLTLGADDYVTKPFNIRELLARIQAQLRRIQSGHSSEGDYQFGSVLVDFLKGKVLRDGDPINVSAKELQLLRYLIARRGSILSRKELLTEVWGYQSTLTRTVDVHVATLRQKLEQNPQQPRYLVTVRGEGYMFCD